ncbi:MAG: glycosyltransferase [Lachnospiraceae bacterium]|nr:glycosyltransferase [Lachnospiraceae bacterium]
MKILFPYFADFGAEDLKKAFEQSGHQVRQFSCSLEDLLSPELGDTLSRELARHPADLLFTFNYYPEAAVFCKDKGLPYVSWVYDCPCVQLFSYTVIFPTNHIYVFDSDTCDYFRSRGIGTIHFLPMAADPDRLLRVAGQTRPRGHAPVSFVGSLYTEKHCFYDRMKGLSPYTAGYLEGVMAAQKKLYGCSIIEESLTENILEDMYRSLPLEPDRGSTVSRRYLFAQYVIARRITQTERSELLELVGKEYPVDLYTPDPAARIPGCTNHGPAHSQLAAPAVYGASKISLNISLRSIVNGIPLRVFEIMGSGGFALSNYQGDLGLFRIGEEVEVFSSPEELLDKTRFYLSHEDSRKAIATQGLRRIREEHTYLHRVPALLEAL